LLIILFLYFRRLYSIRYSLGRRTGAVDSVVTHLKIHWKNLEPFTQKQIKREIRIAIEQDHAGGNCDIESWKEILELKEKEK